VATDASEVEHHGDKREQAGRRARSGGIRPPGAGQRGPGGSSHENLLAVVEALGVSSPWSARLGGARLRVFLRTEEAGLPNAERWGRDMRHSWR
jgi:hypothetical protein